MNEIIVENDPNWPLEKWLEFIKSQIEIHGKDSILYTDAGYNNVEMVIKSCQ